MVRDRDTTALTSYVGIDGRLIIRNNVTEVIGIDTITYLLYDDRNTRITESLTKLSHYNIQLRAYRRFSSGLEFNGGLFFGAGRLRVRPPFSDDLPKDVRVATFDRVYQRIGLSSGITANLLTTKRFQPYASLQVLLLVARDRPDNYILLLPAFDLVLPGEELPAIGPVTNFKTELRLWTGANYSLTSYWSMGFELSVYPSAFAGVQLRYRVTDY